MRARLMQKKPQDLVPDVDRRVALLEESRDLSRIHLVVDMDMFFAAVEMRDNPALENVPMAVGGMGMISTANYIARKFGVRAAMPGFIAKKLCPSLVFVAPNFSKYTEVAKKTREVFRQYDPDFKSGSLDEAYLDITERVMDRIESSSSSTFEKWLIFTTLIDLTREDAAAAVAAELREEITRVTKLTASAGIAVNPRLAKVCSDLNKPNGQYILPFNRDAIMKFVAHLPVRKFGGIGKVREKMLTALGVSTGGDLFEARYNIFHVFSETTAQWFLSLSLGVAEPRQREESGIQKSVSRESTFGLVDNLQTLLEKCQELVRHVHQDLDELDLHGKCLTLKLKTVDFAVKTRAWSCKSHLNLASMLDIACRLVVKEWNAEKNKHKYRLIGIRMSMLEPKKDINSSNGGATSACRQQTLSQTIETKPAPGLCDSSSSSSKEPCPICGHQFDVWSIFLVNEHIEQCLAKTQRPKKSVKQSFFEPKKSSHSNI
ncbi:unnamed protein product [Aphanomyces euteiches]